MRRILIGVLSLHWLVVFTLLAVAATISGTQGTPATLSTFGIHASAATLNLPSGTLAYGALAVGFATVAVLFMWTLLSALADERGFPGETDEVARIAFGAGISMCTVLVVICATSAAYWLLPSIAVQFAALLVSYLVFHADRRAEARLAVARTDDVQATAALMALGAAHNSLLARLPGRSAAAAKEPG